MTTSDQVLFCGSAYAELGAAVCSAAGLSAGELERKLFPDGERYQRFVTPVAGRDVVLLGGTISDQATLELYDLGCAAVKYGARSLTLVIPYFGYSTMERAVRAGEVVTAKTRARLLSSIPDAPFGCRVALVDLHADGLPHYFEGNVRAVHLYAKPVTLAAIRDAGRGDFVLGAPDAGRMKWVESLAAELGVPAGVVLKRRLDGERTEVTAISAAVTGKRVVIYDDMIRTGGSIVHAAQAYLTAGASAVAVVATHGVFPPGAVARLRAAGCIESVCVTDSHPQAKAEAAGWVEVRTLAGLLADFLRQ
ncbi:MAG: ribose-phosphate pyrophosphokinase [Deltaproteobacteria bacterium]|nr:ribose-phosphate pyrophosphokinase [Deltaproteobacteria bacterium]